MFFCDVVVYSLPYQKLSSSCQYLLPVSRGVTGCRDESLDIFNPTKRLLTVKQRTSFSNSWIEFVTNEQSHCLTLHEASRLPKLKNGGL